MMTDPHALLEGAMIASYGIRANHAFIDVRGEAVHAARRLRNAVNEAYRAGYLGRNILGSGFDLDVVVHSGAGAYICGEETALLDSLEGYRGQPRLRPPFPATPISVYPRSSAVPPIQTQFPYPANRRVTKPPNLFSP